MARDFDVEYATMHRKISVPTTRMSLYDIAMFVAVTGIDERELYELVKSVPINFSKNGGTG